jgi:hypothetical protein
MLGKMMKYDLMFGARIYAFMAALTGALILITVGTQAIDSQFIGGVSLFFAIIATVVYAVMFIVISIRHLSTQLCSNESYMNYCFPASTHSLVLSKLLCIFLWGIVSLLLLIFFWSVGIGGIMLAQSEMTLREIWNTIVTETSRMGIRNIGNILSTLSWVGLASSIMSLCLLGFCVTLCNIPFLKERGIGIVTGVVGFFVLQYAINNIINSIATVIFNNMTLDIFDYGFVTELRTPVIYISLAYMVAAVGLYFLTVYTVDKHRFIG